MTREDTTSYKISVTTGAARDDTKAIKELEDEIVSFDRKLERFQQFVTNDLKIYDAVVTARDYLFRLQQLLHGVDIVRFTEGGGTR